MYYHNKDSRHHFDTKLTYLQRIHPNINVKSYTEFYLTEWLPALFFENLSKRAQIFFDTIYFCKICSTVFGSDSSSRPQSWKRCKRSTLPGELRRSLGTRKSRIAKSGFPLQSQTRNRYFFELSAETKHSGLSFGIVSKSLTKKFFWGDRFLSIFCGLKRIRQSPKW